MSDANPNTNAPHTRKEKRTPVTLKIKFKSATLDQFIERYSVDVSHGGIFIRTKDPLAVGTQLRFEFQLQDASPLISGEGTVVWTREHDPNRVGVAPGMGVRFDRLSTESRQVLEKILAQKTSRDSGLEPKFENPALAATQVAPKGTKPMQVAVPKLATPFNGQSKLDEDFDEGVFEQPTRVSAVRDLMKERKEDPEPPVEAPTAPAAAAKPTGKGWLPAERMSTLHGVGAPKREDSSPILSNATPMQTAAAGTPTFTPAKTSEHDAPTKIGGSGPQLSVVPMAEELEAEKAGADERHRPTQLVDPLPHPEDDEDLAAAAASEAPRPRKSSASFMLLGVIGVLAAAGLYLYLNNARQPSASTPTSAAASSPEATAPAAAAAPTPAPTPAPAAAAPVPAAEPAKPAPPPGVEVAVTSEPTGASVEVDGAILGTTPATIRVEPNKKAKVVVKRDCYAPFTVEVDAANAKPVEAKLKALPRVVKVETTPAGAMVLLDGKAVGTAPREIRLAGDPAKSHTLAAKKVGFSQAEQTLGADAVCVSDGKVGRLAVALALIEAPAAAAAPAASAAAPVAVKRPRPPRVEKPPKAEKPAADEDKPAASPAPAPTETKPPADTPPAPADPKTAKPKEEAPPKETPPKETPPADEHTPDWMK